jgi:tetratricopeptide (TPR) repeat protein
MMRITKRAALLAAALSISLLQIGAAVYAQTPIAGTHAPGAKDTPVAARKDGRTGPLLDGLGKHTHKVTTSSPLAQQYFNQGLALTYGFNHAEAIRAFKEAIRLDPDCAMAYWGVATALGPNINAAMDNAAAKEAYAVLQEAQKRMSRATEKEKAFISALAKRYTDKPVADRKPLDKAYAEAMKEVAKRFPDDVDALTLYAESVMNTMPWDYWTKKERAPKPGTLEVIAALERALALNPEHPGANHFYIHIVEASHFPERALSAAHRLPDVAPAAGHLVHMPAHIYIRVGKYHDAVLVNEKSIRADNDYLAQCRRQGYYPMAYVPHNHHFLWLAATMEGNSAKAMLGAEGTAGHVDKKILGPAETGPLQHFTTIPTYAKVRFGKWDEILALPAPEKNLLYPTGVWRYARGMAFARKGKYNEAKAELARLAAIASDKQLEPVMVGLNAAVPVLKVAAEALAGELAYEQGDYATAIRHLEKAVEMEADFTYDEPPPFHYPVRQSLGAVLLAAGRPSEAEKVYREDLKQNPENGWSLFGLLQSLRAVGNTELAAEVESRFREAWKHADVILTSSRF